MRYSLNLILFLIYFLLVQSEDVDRNYLYQKLLKSMNRSKLSPISATSLSTKVRQATLSSKAFNKQYYFQTRREHPVMSTTIFPHRKIYEYEAIREPFVSCSYQQHRCNSSRDVWCCPSYQQCGTYGGCQKSLGSRVFENAIIPMYISTVCCILGCISFCIIQCCKREDTVQFIVPSINNNSTIERLRTLPESDRPSIRPLPRVDLSRYRVTTAPLLRQTLKPPAYEDLVRRNLITTSMEQQSLLPPPTYEEFMRTNYERERYNISNF